jgi:cell division protein FtsB
VRAASLAGPLPGGGRVRAPRQSGRRRARRGLSVRGAVLAIVVAALLLYLVTPLRAYLTQRAELAQLEREARELELENEALRRRVAELHDPEYLEELARRCLGMVRPGEVAFVVVARDGVPTPEPC